MNAILIRKTTKRRFLLDLVEKHGHGNLRMRRYREREYVESAYDAISKPEYQNLSLYYIDRTPDETEENLIHVGTWSDGEGWEFPVYVSEKGETDEKN